MGYYLSIRPTNITIIECSSLPDLRAMQLMVGLPGHPALIEVAHNCFSDSQIVILCDEEGLLKGLIPTLLVRREKMPIVGQIMIVRYISGSETFSPLIKEQVKVAIRELNLQF